LTVVLSLPTSRILSDILDGLLMGDCNYTE